jgi:hypothetical protein
MSFVFPVNHFKTKTTIMEKFMLIFHGGIDQKASPEQMQANLGKWMAWVEKLQKEGKYVFGEALLPGGKIITGKASVADGPYTEGKEIVGGFFVINAPSYDAAVEECRHYPDFDFGGQVQVRQVMKFDM